MKMKKLRLEIKKRVTESDDFGYSYEYDIKLNGHKLGRGVTGVKLDMTASDKPRLIIECIPDELDVDVKALLERYQKGDKRL
ncbi:hypothetical protein HCG60_08130 [Ligilactobacillus murinus]|uniref:Uncharacterized protein n=2 Tax=Ligilactobacillus murinus TaxID=1622 RepID=A0A4Q2AML4_9LACO|nr:hypothetical protein [Ligilactobacillus murinus]NBH41177.1 hypothetical protein [Ligilactobacillus murinus]NBH86542.1 hypothetical protein [Lachnospiraceae bacterium]RII80026.1 hypothetical protein D1870_06180 [Ligilactobacillus murinus]RXV70687.1 hypothetical protein D6C19_07825 [Ligilactobacillus murinus]